MKNSRKSIISLLIISILLFIIVLPNVVRAEDVGRVDTVVEAIGELSKESTLYAGEVFVDGESQMHWLYSEDLSNSSVVFDTLRDNLPNPFASLVPESVTEEGNGIAVSSSHQDEMDSSWTSASYVANQYFSGTVGEETNTNLYDANDDFKGKIDDYDSQHKEEFSDPIDTNKRVMSVLSISTSPTFAMIEGKLTRVDTMTFGFEATTVIYTRVDVTSDSDIIRRTTTNYHTIVDGNFTITGDDSFSKDYKSGDVNKKEDYIVGNYTDDLVVNQIEEYKTDMITIAEGYRTTATINGEISSYYYEVHDEITEDNETGKVVINTVMDKYQVYTLTGTAETKKIIYTLDDEKENQIIFKDYEGIVFVFNTTDILNMTDEELKVIADEMDMDIEDLRKMGTKAIETANNAVKGKGTLIGLYDFSVSDGNGLKEEATEGFKIRIKMTDEMKKYNDFKIAFLKDDGTLEELIELTKNGEYLEGILPHLSRYAVIGNVVEETEEEEQQEEQNNNSTNPKTGDNIVLWIGLMAISLIGVVGTVIYLNKKKQTNK